MSENQAIDNNVTTDDNVVTASNNDVSSAAELIGSEDTAYAKIIETKDAIMLEAVERDNQRQALKEVKITFKERKARESGRTYIAFDIDEDATPF